MTPLLTLPQVSARTLRRLVDAGALPCVRSRGNGQMGAQSARRVQAFRTEAGTEYA